VSERLRDDLNLYAYVGNDPLDRTDPSGETCTQATAGGSYTCQVDSIVDKKGNVTERKDFSKSQQRQVKAFEKAYTAAVNKLESHSSAKVDVSVNGKSEKVTAGYVAKALEGRNVVAAPGIDKGANTNGATNTTTVEGRVLSGAGTLQGVKTPTADALRQIAIVHEGLHGTYVDSVGAGMKPGDFNTAHQAPYNEASDELLRGNQ